jgi:hypothetical protein
LLEECVVQQTSLAPLIGVAPEHAYARWYGVNWVYLLWALGFEAVWAVIVPILLTETLFPERRSEPWLRAPGVITNAVIMAVAGFLAWFMWTRIFLPKFYPKLVYHPPISSIGAAVLVIVGLIAVAAIRSSGPRLPSESAPPVPGLLGVLSFAVSLPWFLIIVLAFGGLPTCPPAFPLIAGPIVAAASAYLLERWTRSRNWGDAHRVAVIAGIVGATLIGGIVTMKTAKALPIDRIAQIVFNLAALVGLVALARRRSGTAYSSR